MDPVAPAAPAGPSSPSSSPSSGGQGQSSSSSSSGAPSSSPGGQQPSGGSSAPSSNGNPAPQNPVAAQRFKRTLTMDGKSQEVEASEEELWAAYRKGKTADSRFEEAARLRKEAKETAEKYKGLLGSVKENPRALLEFLREQGIENPMDHVANALQAEMAEEERLADPNVRARVEAEKKLEEYQRREQQQLQQQRIQQLEQEVEREIEAISGVFVEALELSGLPKDDDTLAIMASLESENRRRGYNIEAKELAKITNERVLGRGARVLTAMNDQQLLKANPELTLRFKKAIYAQLLAEKEAKQGGVRTGVPQPIEPKVEAPKQPKISDEYDLIGTPGRKTLRSI